MHKIIVEIQWDDPDDPYFLRKEDIECVLSMYVKPLKGVKVIPVWEPPKQQKGEHVQVS